MYVVNRLYQAWGSCFSLYRLVEKANVIGLRRINKSSRLAAVDGLREGVMQEHILHVKLMNMPVVGDG
jgi:hypothetical protein